jgi:hypothetical protein
MCVFFQKQYPAHAFRLINQYKTHCKVKKTRINKKK